MPLRSGWFKAILNLCFAVWSVCSVFSLVMLLLRICTNLLDGGKSPIAKPGCPDKCGYVSVPFPFGLKEGCYLNSRSKGFFLNCSHNETLFFSPTYGSHQFRVSYIDTSGYLHVYTPVVNAYNNQIISKSIITSPEFPLDPSFNKFRVVGCDTVGNITMSGHSSSCSTICTSDETDLSSECLGIGCCQTRTITAGVWNYTIQLRRTRNQTKMGGKEYPASSAFLAYNESYEFMKSDLNNLKNRDGSPTMIIHWAVKKIENESCIEARSDDSYACQAKHAYSVQSQNPIGYVCRCNSIFEGNPYLAGGCRSGSDNGNLSDVELFSGRVFVFGGGPCALVIVVILYSHEKKIKLNKRKEMLFRKNGGHLLQGSLTRFQGVTNPIRIFTENEMEKATDKFDDKNIIGRGGFGTVYKGYLPELGTLAIKKSNAMNQSKIEIELFINEVMLLSKIYNQNVVAFLGCCLEMDVPLLIFEFVSNGTLKSHLHDATNQLIMPWATRLKVATQTAGVLTYLHNNHCPPIIHRDVKPDNVLLDEGFNAKVSDFGISRLVPQHESRIETGVKGTLGYLDPEYLRTLELTEKSDVYSFGVLLVELITRKKLGTDEGSILVYKFGSLMKDNSVHEIIDQDIKNDENVGQIMEVAQVANQCVREKGEDRPTMDEVAVRLKILWAEIKHKQSQDAHSIRSNSTGSHKLSVCLSGGR